MLEKQSIIIQQQNEKMQKMMERQQELMEKLESKGTEKTSPKETAVPDSGSMDEESVSEKGKMTALASDKRTTLGEIAYTAENEELPGMKSFMIKHGIRPDPWDGENEREFPLWLELFTSHMMSCDARWKVVLKKFKSSLKKAKIM